MRTKPLFLSLDSSCLAREISLAERSVCYAAPGILMEPAEALAALSRRSARSSSPSVWTSTNV
jgi:hypothetical protein